MYEQYNYELFKQIKDKMQEQESLEEFCNIKNLSKEDQILCINPKHHDHAPSCYVNRAKNVYKCFSCQDGGGYHRFIWQYARKYEGLKLNEIDYMEKQLRTNVKMQRKYGVKTLKTKIEISQEYLDYLEEIRRKRKSSRKMLSHAHQNNKELFDELMGSNSEQYDLSVRLNKAKTTDDKLNILADIQRGGITFKN